MNLEWTDALAVGNAEIDDQHKEIFIRFNRFNTACNQGRARSELDELYRFLLDYIRTHFQHEQQIQFETGYPDQDSHKREHEKFTREVERLANALASRTSASMVVETNLTLTRWLMRHIQMSDQKFVEFLREKPLESR